MIPFSRPHRSEPTPLSILPTVAWWGDHPSTIFYPSSGPRRKGKVRWIFRGVWYTSWPRFLYPYLYIRYFPAWSLFHGKELVWSMLSCARFGEFLVAIRVKYFMASICPSPFVHTLSSCLIALKYLSPRGIVSVDFQLRYMYYTFWPRFCYLYLYICYLPAWLRRKLFPCGEFVWRIFSGDTCNIPHGFDFCTYVSFLLEASNCEELVQSSPSCSWQNLHDSVWITSMICGDAYDRISHNFRSVLDFCDNNECLHRFLRYRC